MWTVLLHHLITGWSMWTVLLHHLITGWSMWTVLLHHRITGWSMWTVLLRHRLTGRFIICRNILRRTFHPGQYLRVNLYSEASQRLRKAIYLNLFDDWRVLISLIVPGDFSSNGRWTFSPLLPQSRWSVEIFLNPEMEDKAGYKR